MRFRITRKGAVFYVQRRTLFFWLTEQRELGWNCSEDIPFASISDAEKHISQTALGDVQTTYQFC